MGLDGLGRQPHLPGTGWGEGWGGFERRDSGDLIPRRDGRDVIPRRDARDVIPRRDARSFIRRRDARGVALIWVIQGT